VLVMAVTVYGTVASPRFDTRSLKCSLGRVGTDLAGSEFIDSKGTDAAPPATPTPRAPLAFQRAW
jgi:hypothetical protein